MAQRVFNRPARFTSRDLKQPRQVYIPGVFLSRPFYTRVNMGRGIFRPDTSVNQNEKIKYLPREVEKETGMRQ